MHDNKTGPSYQGASLVDADADYGDDDMPDFKKWDTCDWCSVIWMMAAVVLLTVVSILAIAGAYEGKNKYNDVFKKANASLALLDEAREIVQDCFTCTEQIQKPSVISPPPEFLPTPGKYNMLFNSTIRLTKDAALKTHFEKFGIRMPGITFGVPASGGFTYNNPVIITRGMVTNDTKNTVDVAGKPTQQQQLPAMSIIGQPGLTSLAYIAKSTPVANRCNSLYTTRYTEPESIFSQVPMYILYDDSPSPPTIVKYYFCMCIYNVVPGAMPGMEADYERCASMTVTNL